MGDPYRFGGPAREVRRAGGRGGAGAGAEARGGGGGRGTGRGRGPAGGGCRGARRAERGSSCAAQARCCRADRHVEAASARCAHDPRCPPLCPPIPSLWPPAASGLRALTTISTLASWAPRAAARSTCWTSLSTMTSSAAR